MSLRGVFRYALPVAMPGFWWPCFPHDVPQCSGATPAAGDVGPGFGTGRREVAIGRVPDAELEQTPSTDQLHTALRSVGAPAGPGGRPTIRPLTAAADQSRSDSVTSTPPTRSAETL